MPSHPSLERPPRSLDEISAAVRHMVNSQFYALDQAYRYEDRKYTGRLDIEMLHRILKSCQEELTWPEMTALWSSLDRAPDGMYTWSRFCHKFMDKEAKERARGAQRPAPNASAAAPNAQPAATATGGVTGNEKQTNDHATNKSTDGALAMILDKLPPTVLKSYGLLQHALERADPANSSLVSDADVRRIFAELHPPVIGSALDEILVRFGASQPGSFAYRRFLEALANHRYSTYAADVKEGTAKSSRNARVSAALRSSLASRLAGQQKVFKRACKAIDKQGRGYLTIAGLRSAMEKVNITLSEEEIFVLFNEHDKKLTGSIDYKGLISSLLGNAV